MAEYKTIDEAKAAWAKANASGDTAGMDAAHKAAEAIRAQSGYSGGDDGSQYIPLTTTTTPNITPTAVTTPSSITAKQSYTPSGDIPTTVKTDATTNNKVGSTGTDYSGYTKYDTTTLPSSIDNKKYTSSLSYNPTYGGQSNVTQAQAEKYLPTTDASANSNLWWQVNNDENLNQSQKNYLQQLLHEANEQILGNTATYSKSTGVWTDNNTGNQVNIVTDENKYSSVPDTNRTANTIDYTYKDGKYYYNGKEIKPVEYRTASGGYTGGHVGEAFVIDGNIYRKNDNWTATPLSDIDNTTGKNFAIYDGNTIKLIPASAYRSFSGAGEDYKDYMDVPLIAEYVDAFLEDDNEISSEEESELQAVIQQYLEQLYGGEE